MSNIDAINEAAKKYAIDHPLGVDNPMRSILKSSFEAGATSDAAKQYWFEQFKAEHKHTIVTDLPAPPYDDSVTHNLELVSLENGKT